MLFPYTFEKLFPQIFAMNIYFGYRIIKDNSLSFCLFISIKQKRQRTNCIRLNHC